MHMHILMCMLALDRYISNMWSDKRTLAFHIMKDALIDTKSKCWRLGYTYQLGPGLYIPQLQEGVERHRYPNAHKQLPEKVL